MTMMRARGDFFYPFERPQPPAGNDNRLGDESFTLRSVASEQLTYTLTIFSLTEDEP